MGLKRRSKVSAEFSMSSLTDIIFLLLIFFMLTSTLIRVKPFPLPKSDAKTVAPTSVVVSIEQNGQHSVNGRPLERGAVRGALNEALDRNKQEDKSRFTVTIVAEMGTPFDDVVEVMQMANQMGVKAIIATEPRNS